MGGADRISAAQRRRRVSGSPPNRITINTPAKLNLGLEVIGRRHDGFHEIATIFLAVDLYDRVILTRGPEVSLQCDNADIPDSENLALRALHALQHESGYEGGAHLDLRKRIPAAAGLGGASSDAAATLLAARELWNLDISDEALHSIASSLGSDVPFFLHGGCAVGRGRGELLTPLPDPEGLTLVVIVPGIAIPNKTKRLYASLHDPDFSDGRRITNQSARIASGLPVAPAMLGNAFARPLYALVPELAALPQICDDAGAPAVAISGAGPAHYVPFYDSGQADLVATHIRARLPDSWLVTLVKPVTNQPSALQPL